MSDLRTLALALVLLCVSCAHVPPLSPIPNGSQADTVARCRQAFPRQPWRATHTIFATLPFGHNGALIGVTAAGPEGLHAVLLSAEGITLYDGIQAIGADGRAHLKVQRAVSPFDRPSFAASLMADVGNAFLPPRGEPSAVGRNARGETACRWTPPGGETTDIELTADGPIRLRTLRNLRLSRQIEFLGTPQEGFFPEVRLTVPGAGGYTLDMTLVDHE